MPDPDITSELKAARLLHDKAFTYYYQADDEIRRHLDFLILGRPGRPQGLPQALLRRP